MHTRWQICGEFFCNLQFFYSNIQSPFTSPSAPTAWTYSADACGEPRLTVTESSIFHINVSIMHRWDRNRRSSAYCMRNCTLKLFEWASKLLFNSVELQGFITEIDKYTISYLILNYSSTSFIKSTFHPFHEN